jgi:hypothetical protein
MSVKFEELDIGRKKYIAILVVLGLAVVGLGIWKYPRQPSGPVSVEGEVSYFSGPSDDQNEIGPVKIHLEKEDAELFWATIENGTPVSDRNDSMCAGFRVEFQKGGPVIMDLGTSGIVRYDYRTILTRYGFHYAPRRVISVNMAVIKKLMQPFYDEYVKQNGIKNDGYWPTDNLPPSAK